MVFFGTPSFAMPVLASLLEGPDRVIAVVSQPDRPKGRGKKIGPPPVKDMALRRGLAVLQPERAKEEPFLRTLRELSPDLLVVVAYGQILPKSLLNLAHHGAVNVHASLLPRYRGAAPIPWAILEGEEVTGVTTMMMDEGMDTGDILMQAETPIGESETAGALETRLAVLGARLLRETVEGLKAGTIYPKPQDHCRATYAPSIKKEEQWIDWTKEAGQIERQVRALNPSPGVRTRWDGRVLKIYKGEVRKQPPREGTGKIVWAGADFLEVQTGKDSFLIRELQMEGGKRMDVRQFLSGHAVPVGTQLG